jgi:hypothetical protein
MSAASLQARAAHSEQSAPSGEHVLESSEHLLSEEAVAIKLSEEEALTKENEDVLQALLQSKADQAPLSAEGATLFRLTHCSQEISDMLVASPELADCCHRVTSASCEVRPSWANGALLLLPLTVEQIREAGVKLKAHNIFALISDKVQIELALAGLPHRRRPKVKPEHAAESSPDTAVQEIEIPELIVQRTFIHAVSGASSADSEEIRSAPCGSTASREPPNPRKKESRKHA